MSYAEEEEREEGERGENEPVMMVGLKARISPIQFRTELSVKVLTLAKPIGICEIW